MTSSAQEIYTILVRRIIRDHYPREKALPSERDIADEFDAQFPGTFTLSRFGQPGIDIAAAALQELAKAGVPADNIVSSRPRVNAATQYLSEDEELAGICAADGEGDPKLSERFNKIRRSLCTLENPLWFSHRRASLAKKQHEGRMLALIVRE